MSSPLPAAGISIDTISATDNSVSVVDFDAKINPKDAKRSCILRGFLDRVQEETVGTVGVVAGLVMAVKAMKTWADLSSITSTIEKIQRAKSVYISDLRFFTPKENESEKLVLVRGFVQPQNYCPTVKSQVSESSIQGVLLKTTTCEFRNDVGLRFRLPIPKVSLITTPMAISSSVSGRGSWVNIDLKGVDSLPLETTYSKSFIHVINPFFYGLKEEKILPVGKEITVVGRVVAGVGRVRRRGFDHLPWLQVHQDLPFSVTDMTKDQILEKLIFKKYVFICSGVALGSLSVFVLIMSFRRHWRKWKQQKQNQVINV